MVRKLFILAFIGLLTINVAVADDALQCYQCNNCTKVTDNDLKTCIEDNLVAPGPQTTDTVKSTTAADKKVREDPDTTTTTEIDTTTTTEIDTTTTTEIDTTTTTEIDTTTTGADTTTTTTGADTTTTTTGADTTTTTTGADTTTTTTGADTTTTTTGADTTTTTGDDTTTDTGKITDFSCYIVKNADGETNRGCTKKVSECKDLVQADIGECKLVCDEKGCNPATNIQSLAFSTITLVAIIKMLLY